MKKLVGKSTWFLDKKATIGTENNENMGGSASGNPMLATPNPSANSGGQASYIQSLGESARGNPMLTPPSHSQNRGQSSKNRGAKAMTAQVLKLSQPKTTSVLTVEITKGGTLASALRRRMETESLTPMLGFKFRVVEAAGTSLADMLSNKNLWQGSAYGRKHCHTCK